jgi:hypothetical protein
MACFQHWLLTAVHCWLLCIGTGGLYKCSSASPQNNYKRGQLLSLVTKAKGETSRASSAEVTRPSLVFVGCIVLSTRKKYTVVICDTMMRDSACHSVCMAIFRVRRADMETVVTSKVVKYWWCELITLTSTRCNKLTDADEPSQLIEVYA